MANRPKPIKLPGTFMQAVERLLNTAPPPKGKTKKAAAKKPTKKKAR